MLDVLDQPVGQDHPKALLDKIQNFFAYEVEIFQTRRVGATREAFPKELGLSRRGGHDSRDPALREVTEEGCSWMPVVLVDS